MNKRFITGNSFPMNLIRRKAVITPESLDNYLAALDSGSWESFWGHANTLRSVNQLCRHDLSPRVERPALQTDEEGYPVLYGEAFKECWVLSPEYASGFRPAIGVEVSAEQIKDWQVLHISWE